MLKRDKRKLFRFVALQSAEAQEIFVKYKLPPMIDSVVLIDGENYFTESDVVVKIAAILPFPWRVLAVFRVLPASLRNRIYRFIAARRYRWFGRQSSCRVIENQM